MQRLWAVSYTHLYKHADGASYAEQGLVKKLPDDWKTRWPNLAEAYEGTVVGPLLEEQFGGTYFLPRPVFANNQPTEPLVTHQSIFMRKDWLEAVGAEVKQAYTCLLYTSHKGASGFPAFCLWCGLLHTVLPY